jgi:hypothetical protein
MASEHCQTNVYYGVDGTWKKCEVYHGVDGVWKKVQPYCATNDDTKTGG